MTLVMMAMIRTTSGPDPGPGGGAGAGALGGERTSPDAAGWTVVLTRPELYLLAMVARAGHVLGLDDPFLGCLAEEVNGLLGFARRSLIARGHLLVEPDETLTLPPSVAGLIRSNSQARRTLVLSSAEQVRLVHMMARQCVEQEALAGARIGLRAVAGTEAVTTRIGEFLRLPAAPAAPGVTAALGVSDLVEARRLALDGDQDASHAVLARAGLAPETAGSLVGALQNRKGSGSVTTLLRETRAIRYGESAAWIIGDRGAWLVQALDQRRGAVRLVPASSEAIWRRVATIAGGAR